MSETSETPTPPPHHPQGVQSRGVGSHCRRNRVHRGGHLLHRLYPRQACRSRRLPPPATPPAPGDDAATGQSARWARGSASRPRPGRARPGAVVRQSSRDTRSVTDNQQPGVHPRHRAAPVHGTFVTATLYGGCRPSDIQKMTETPQPAAPPPSAATTSPPPSPQQEKPPRLYRAAAWVVIVAGIVFTVAVIFFSGALVLGQGKCPYHRYYHHGMFRPVGPVAPGPGMGWVFGFPGGPPPPGMGPGFPGGPGGPAVGPTGPGPTTAPARP